jgi:protein-S-isoprenylcysteine O-methyltransferase Ste14
MGRTFALAYGVASYLVFLASFVYAIGFVGNLLVPKSIDSGVGGPGPLAFAVDVSLLGLFAVPHSVMARQWFKRWWTRIIPPVAERSTYVLVSSLLLGLLFWQWRPLPGVLWDVTNPIGRGLVLAVFWAGWAIAILSTFLINHFDLFGLRQVSLAFSGRAYPPVEFKTPFLYLWVRHPLMLGLLLAFWAAPTMTLGRLLFAAATTAYVLLALPFEERDLVSFYGERYEAYKRQAGLLLPKVRKPW